MEKQTGIDRLPPYNLEAEEAVLGAALIDPHATKTVCEEVVEDHFYDGKNKKIFGALKELTSIKKPVDLIILTDYLKQQNYLESAGGAAYLSQLVEKTTTAANLRAHISILKDKATRRALIQECQASLRDSYGEEETIDIIAGLHQKTDQLAAECTEKDYLTGRDLAKIVGDDIKDRITNGIRCSGLSTGFDDLDLLIGGFDAGQLITIGGVTGGGKTTVMLDLANSIAVKNHNCVVYFSVEMAAKEIGYKFLPKITGIDAQKIKTATLDEEEIQKVRLAIETLQNTPLLIDDTPNIKFTQLAGKLRRLLAREGVKIAFVDYVQIVRNPQKGQSRFEEVASLALGFKGLARELGIPIVIGAQINRDYKQRQDKRPMVDDIRESAQVGHESDIVMFIHRDSCFDHGAGNGAELIVRKCRSGRTGTVKLWWDDKTVRFYEQ